MNEGFPLTEEGKAQAEELGAALTVKELDLSGQEFTDALASAPVYAKTATVKARQAEPGEKITTVLGDGSEETVNTAKEGDWVVTNPGGEAYIIGSDKFGSRYEATDETGVFRAKGLARAIQNPTGSDIKIMAPWGEEQHGDTACMIATVYDPENPDEIGADRYLIGGKEFAETYALAEAYVAEHPPLALQRHAAAPGETARR